MKHLFFDFTKVSNLLKLFLLFFLFFNTIQNSFAQTYVQWSNNGSGGVIGTFPGGTVTVNQTGTGNNVSIDAPADYQQNLVVTGNNTFHTFGPTTNPPSKQVTFTFSTPVIVTQYNMSDIDLGPSWNDTFAFQGITFSSTTSVNCNSTTTGVTATNDVDISAEYARWFTSTSPISTFSLNYATTGGRTHAYLAYSMQVILAPTQNVVVVNNATICQTSNATITATNSIAGNYSYSWTVPVGAVNPGNVSSFTTSTAGTYSVIVTDTTSGITSTGSGIVSASTLTTPTFNQVQPICSGGNFVLPTTSLNSISGSWSPTINNTQTTTYLFTPSSGACANTTQMTVVVNPIVTPTFTQVASICEGGNFVLPTVSLNSISGTWSPTINTAQTTTYLFTPSSGSCTNTTQMTVVVNPRITPTFNAVAPICEGDNFVLPTVSLNSISGTWSPTINTTQTTTYLFTPLSGLCANTTQMTVVVNPRAIPQFNVTSPLCFELSYTLPTTSLNGISGSWSPAFNSSVTTNYTFTPNSNECSTTANVNIIILNDFDFEILNTCIGNDYVLTANALNSSFDEALATYNWQYNNQNIGNNNSQLNLTSYLNSTLIEEQFPITINLTITNAEGCLKTKPYFIDSIYCGIQQGISPNGDGINEFFDLRFLNVKHLSIFNRYGTKVYSKNGYSNQWIGESDSGNVLPDGTYYYFIEFYNDRDSKTGWIYINR